MKTILINIQIDNVKAKDLADLEEILDEALKEYRNKRINYNLTDMFGPAIPVQEG